MEIINSRRFQLDFKHGILTVDNEELILHIKNVEHVSEILTEDVSMPDRTEIILV